MTTTTTPRPPGIPVRCALCGTGLYRWYYGMRAPMCALCTDKSGPVLAPALWEIDPHRCSPAARRVWESWAANEYRYAMLSRYAEAITEVGYAVETSSDLPRLIVTAKERD